MSGRKSHRTNLVSWDHASGTSLGGPVWHDSAAKRIAKATMRSSSELVYPKLADEAGGQPRIREAPPPIFHPEEFRYPGYMDVCRDALAKYRDTVPVDRRVLFDRFRLLDVAINVVGIGSVGTMCMVALFMSLAEWSPLMCQTRALVFLVQQIKEVPRGEIANEIARVVVK
jgi:hypothetical protein